MGSKILAPVLLVLLLSLFFATGALAGDAEVLPKGVRNVFLGNFFYPFPTTERFNKDGALEEIAAAFNNRLLDSTVFPTLLPPGQNIGTTFVKFRYDFNILNFGVQYGFTDRLTGGIDIPYYYAHNEVKISLDPSGATLGVSTGPGVGPCSGPILPLRCPNSRPFTTEDIQQLLTSRFGFKRVQDFTASGLGDIVAGLKYQYLRTADWRLAASLGARFPTGRQDDPDDLTDIPWSPGNYAVLLRLHHDYALSNLWKKPLAVAGAGPAVPQAGDAILNFTFRYDWNLPTDVTIRIADPSNPITTNRERVNRDFGDKFEFEFSGKYYLLKGLSFTGLYRFGFKLEDSIKGSMGFPYEAVEQDTDSNEQLYIIGVDYSLLPLYMEKKFPLPLRLSLAYRERFAGRGPSNAASPSQVLKTRYINFTLNVPF